MTLSNENRHKIITLSVLPLILQTPSNIKFLMGETGLNITYR